MSADSPQIWIRRPALCREKGCNLPVAWAVLYGPPGTAPRFEGSCEAHAEPIWKTTPVRQDEDRLVTVAVRLEEPEDCALFPDGEEPCTNPGDCLVVRFDEAGGPFVFIPVCTSCMQRQSIDVPDEHAVLWPPMGEHPLDDAFGPPPWWQRYVVDPELGNILGPDYVALIRRVTVTWEDLFWVAVRGAALGLPAALAMAFVPRGAWWLLIGLLPVVVGYLVGRIVGFYRVEGGVFSDPESETRLEDGQLVSDVPENERGDAMQFRLDPIAGAAAFLLLFVSPGLISAALLILLAAPLGIGYGHTVAGLGILPVLTFLVVGVLVSGLAAFAVRFAWNLLVLLPLLFAYWFLGGDE